MGVAFPPTVSRMRSAPESALAPGRGFGRKGIRWRHPCSILEWKVFDDEVQCTRVYSLDGLAVELCCPAEHDSLAEMQGI